jgi:hypothetical protein
MAIPVNGFSTTTKRVPQRFTLAGDIPKQEQPRRPERSYDEDRQTILAYVEDFARELADGASLKSSTSRAYNLFKRSGLPMESFIARMFEARSITKESSASIRSNGNQNGVRKSKMAYFFGCLETKLELHETEETEGGIRKPQPLEAAD